MTKNKIIKELSGIIKEKLIGSTLFGEPIDMEDPDMVIVAASMMARAEELKDKLETMALMRSLRGAI